MFQILGPLLQYTLTIQFSTQLLNVPDVVVGAPGEVVVADGHVLVAAHLDARRLPEVAHPAPVERVVVDGDVLRAFQLAVLVVVELHRVVPHVGEEGPLVNGMLCYFIRVAFSATH